MCPALCCLIGASLNSCMELDDSVYTTIVSDKYHYTEKDMVAILGNAYTPWRSVVIGAIILGPTAGAILGGVFGITSFIQCFGISAFGTLLFGINPVLTISSPFICSRQFIYRHSTL